MFLVILLFIFSILSAHVTRNALMSRFPKYSSFRKSIMLDGVHFRAPEVNSAISVQAVCDGKTAVVPVKYVNVYDSGGDSKRCAAPPDLPRSMVGKPVILNITSGNRTHTIEIVAPDLSWWSSAISSVSRSE